MTKTIQSKPKVLRTDIPLSPDFQQSPTLEKIFEFENQYQEELLKKDPSLSTLDKIETYPIPQEKINLPKEEPEDQKRPPYQVSED